MAINTTPFKLRGKSNDMSGEKKDVTQERWPRKLTLKEMQTKQYPFLDFDVSGIFDDLLNINLIELPEMKWPEEAGKTDDLKYCKKPQLLKEFVRPTQGHEKEYEEPSKQSDHIMRQSLESQVQTVIFTKAQEDEDDDKESVAAFCHISCDDEIIKGEVATTYHTTLSEEASVEEEDVEIAPTKLEEDVKTTVDELKEINLSDVENPRPIYISALLIDDEEETYVELEECWCDVQRAVQKIFDDKLHKNVECYVDDLVVKSKMRQDHLQDLMKIFERLRRYQLKMNPLKCACGVTSRKFLVFIVHHRGIETEKAKIDAILKMPEPRNIHGLKSLQGRLGYLQRSIKSYLMKPPVLVAPVPGRPLILYIAAQECLVGALLVQENDEGKESALYYLSRITDS
ncbi:UNVERIFIED_CONTAM: hypothetical protein Scaly_2550400 [Sesamum calycinum]|uniref:Reverse transcriptase/retrotransposon-derived protein RNase H-like domain-containing protein n=1 Tax=Sesamum calycinum TaxID=2727403 RepID=A0AAW2IZR5_9LAMI